ncbi:MAG: GNAT family N-acetyltransferase [Solirubrobacteraceae bacterium]|nr:GNAT family N-acetyltransferase [Solirubrobacteraceae bacterium]
MSEQLIAMGVDGAKGGWVAARLWRDPDTGAESTDVHLYGSIDEIAAASDGSTIAIDIPIGLPTGGEARPCDEAARQLLAPRRHSSVFPAPARWMLKYAGDYTGLSTHVLQRVADGEKVKSISMQGHALIPKIREVDRFLAAEPDAAGWLVECHPELSFRALNHGEPMAESKKTEEGREARRQLLTEVFSDAADVLDLATEAYPRSTVAIDDLHDAYACLHTALACAEGLHEFVGAVGVDDAGRPMRMACAPARVQHVRKRRDDVALRAATAADIPFLVEAERSEHAHGFIGASTEEEHAARLDDPAIAVLVVSAGDDEPAGFVILGDLDDAHGNVEVVRFVVTRPGEGIGGPALALAIDHAFTWPSPHRVWLDVVPENATARRLYSGLGFVEEGQQRESWIGPDGNRISLLILSVLRHEWARPG